MGFFMRETSFEMEIYCRSILVNNGCAGREFDFIMGSEQVIEFEQADDGRETAHVTAENR